MELECRICTVIKFHRCSKCSLGILRASVLRYVYVTLTNFHYRLPEKPGKPCRGVSWLYTLNVMRVFQLFSVYIVVLVRSSFRRLWSLTRVMFDRLLNILWKSFRNDSIFEVKYTYVLFKSGFFPLDLNFTSQIHEWTLWTYYSWKNIVLWRMKFAFKIQYLLTRILNPLKFNISTNSI